ATRAAPSFPSIVPAARSAISQSAPRFRRRKSTRSSTSHPRCPCRRMPSSRAAASPVATSTASPAACCGWCAPCPTRAAKWSAAPLHRHGIEAVVPSRVCMFEVEALRDLRRRFPGFEHTLLERACRDLDDAHDSMLLLARLAPLERLASFLLRLRRQMRIRDDEPKMSLPMGRGDIADHLGLTVETVSRSFTRLREQGLIALPDPQHAAILVHAALA